MFTIEKTSQIISKTVKSRKEFKISKIEQEPFGKNNRENFLTEFEKRKVKVKKARKNIQITTATKLTCQLNHFGNSKKSTTKPGCLNKVTTGFNITESSKALLNNDYFKVIDFQIQDKSTPPPSFKSIQYKSQTLTSKLLIVNEDFVKHDAKKLNGNNFLASNNNNRSIFCQIDKEYERLIKQKEKLGKNRTKTYLISQEQIKNLIRENLKNANKHSDLLTKTFESFDQVYPVKNYDCLYWDELMKNRNLINAINVYEELQQHYLDIPVAQNCLKKKFINHYSNLSQLQKIEGMEAEMLSPSEVDKLMGAAKAYCDLPAPEQQQNEIRSNDLKQIQTQENPIAAKQVKVVEAEIERSVTPEPFEDIFSSESFLTPPSQRLVVPDMIPSTSLKYQKIFYEKKSKNEVASLYELPKNFVNVSHISNINTSLLKKIDLSKNTLNIKQAGEHFNFDFNRSLKKSISLNRKCRTARLIVEGQVDVSNLTMEEEEEDCEDMKEQKESKFYAKKCLLSQFDDADNTSNYLNDFDFQPINYTVTTTKSLSTLHRNVDSTFLRPKYFSKEENFNFPAKRSRYLENDNFSFFSADEYQQQNNSLPVTLESVAMEMEKVVFSSRKKQLSPEEYNMRKKYCPDTLEQFKKPTALSPSAQTLADISKEKSPKLKFYPYFQFDRN